MQEKLRPYPATVNDEGMYHHARQVAATMLGQDNVRVGAQLMGAEDFSFYAQKFAGAFFFIGVRNTSMEAMHPLHSPYFVIDEDVLPVGAAFHAAVAMEYLIKHTTAAHWTVIDCFTACMDYDSEAHVIQIIVVSPIAYGFQHNFLVRNYLPS